MRRVALLLVPAVALAFVWQVTPLKNLLRPEEVVEAYGAIRGAWWGPLVVIGACVLGNVLMVPLTLLLLAIAAMFPFPLNLLIAETQMLLSALALWALGRRAGAGVVDRTMPADLRAQLDDLGTKGLLGLAALRWVPVAHFGLLSIALGALGISAPRFFLSTLIGQTPVVTLWVVLGDRVRAWLMDPNLRSLGLLFGVLVSVVMVAVGMRAWSRRRRAVRPSDVVAGP